MPENDDMTRSDGIRLRPAAAIVVVPPFALQDRPVLGVHLLQAAARQSGYDVQILYANILFAAHFGAETHDTLTRFQYGLYLGERLFCRAAFGGQALGRDGGQALVDSLISLGMHSTVNIDSLRGIESEIPAWLDGFIPAVVAGAFPVAGCSTSFEQNCASLAILGKVKREHPCTLAILGGANCDGEMAKGICSLSDDIDYVFSGDSERTFAGFLDAVARGTRPAARIIRGEPCMDMDLLPTPDFSDYYEQMRILTSKNQNRSRMYLNYETSRGCWWGEKKGCTFCGLNSHGKRMRSKTPDRVIEELSNLLARHPTNLVSLTDNIMPRSYFRDLLPRLVDELPEARFCCEQKANLSLSEVELLVGAGVIEIQPGIEALSTGLLRLMNKGTDAARNIALLRYARATGLILRWNLLYGFPGDALLHYTETLELLPLLVHLYPPFMPARMIIARFSPYFDHPERYGIRDIKPCGFYDGVFPEDTDLARLAYHFEGRFATDLQQYSDMVASIRAAVNDWKSRFHSASPPELRVIRDGSSFLMIDSRGLIGIPAEQKISKEQAAMALVTRPVGEQDGTDYQWAIDNLVVVERDHQYIALAVAEPFLIHAFEANQEHGSGHASAPENEQRTG